MSDNDPIVGIDLGTAFSSVAWVDDHGKAVLIPNAEGKFATPSVICFADGENLLVGDEALKLLVADPTCIARFFKFHMGDPNYRLVFFDLGYSAQELAAVVLRKLKEDAEESLCRPVTDAVLAVPAYFNAAQRGAAVEAGAIAGLRVHSLINEPTAAALAFGLHRLGSDRRLMVFDLGGGTFDVTVMEVRGQALQTIACDGIAELGGKDWDDRLVNHAASSFIEEFGIDPRDDPLAWQEIYERCLNAKIALSTQTHAPIPINFRGSRMTLQVTAETFCAICADLVALCVDTCDLVLEKAGMKWADIDDLVLVGGSTRMPMVRNAIRRASGKQPVEGVDPEASVAIGAALAAVLKHRPDHPAFRHNVRLKAGEERRRARSVADAILPMSITDAATHPLGVIALQSDLREQIITLIPEGAALPAEGRGRFAYAFDGMTAVRVEVTEGLGTTRDEVMVIGDLILDNLPPRPRGTPIDVVYRYRDDQVLEVRVIDVETGASQGATIVLRGSLTSEGVAQARQRLDRVHLT
jgi:molecular chaperone DnaK